ncbi:MAG: hypothetical protein JO247_13130 [Chloroflexi bacterium]|nr:hypothetical protein [Chloroflexota bacterium]
MYFLFTSMVMGGGEEYVRWMDGAGLAAALPDAAALVDGAVLAEAAGVGRTGGGDDWFEHAAWPSVMTNSTSSAAVMLT